MRPTLNLFIALLCFGPFSLPPLYAAAPAQTFVEEQVDSGGRVDVAPLEPADESLPLGSSDEADTGQKQIPAQEVKETIEQGSALPAFELSGGLELLSTSFVSSQLTSLEVGYWHGHLGVALGYGRSRNSSYSGFTYDIHTYESLTPEVVDLKAIQSHAQARLMVRQEFDHPTRSHALAVLKAHLGAGLVETLETCVPKHDGCGPDTGIGRGLRIATKDKNKATGQIGLGLRLYPLSFIGIDMELAHMIVFKKIC